MMNKIVLITGASSGIGKATAEKLLDDGYLVYASARRIDKLQALAAKGAKVLELDVTQDESMKSAVDFIICESGRIDILVNNAGYGSYGALEDVPIEEAKYQFEVNVFGLARLTQLVLPYMRKNSFGKIVNITSIGGKIYEPLGSWYHSTKFAVEGLSDCLRLELKPFGIDVIIVEPGATLTEWGAIAVDKLLQTSGNTAYATAAQTGAKLLAFTSDEKLASKPEVIADTISKALKAKKPKARYATGSGATFLVTFRKFASDGLMDSLMQFMIKQASRR
ncbi:SDR family NAD(P)-dependent oxidoreductase [Nostoc sp. C052]|uniref:oxidoreductase n=1 Tax=Nostoc sp. C052 TaxID=2576902 RepID=UPI0015C2DE70|nr:oxidoreductase [Nostoc sp. C052]QLE39763.1 SDR family NAD(P)-dependent oxidoreductase [Nostoc sp. C052]